MVLFDFQCQSCGRIEERMIDRDTETVICTCGGTMTKYFGRSAGARLNDDAGWIKTVVEVVDKDSQAPHVAEFRRNPTRENMRKWMQGEGIRHLEDNEKPNRRPGLDVKRHAEKIMQMRMERNRIEVRG